MKPSFINIKKNFKEFIDKSCYNLNHQLFATNLFNKTLTSMILGNFNSITADYLFT